MTLLILNTANIRSLASLAMVDRQAFSHTHTHTHRAHIFINGFVVFLCVDFSGLIESMRNARLQGRRYLVVFFKRFRPETRQSSIAGHRANKARELAGCIAMYEMCCRWRERDLVQNTNKLFYWPIIGSSEFSRFIAFKIT